MPGCPTFSDSVETLGWVRSGSKQTRAAHFLFPEQNTHTHTHVGTHNWENKNGPVLRGLLMKNELFMKNCFHANVSGRVTVPASFLMFKKSLILQAFYVKDDIYKAHIRSKRCIKVTEVELCLCWSAITAYKIWKWDRDFKTAAAILCTCSHHIFFYENVNHSFLSPNTTNYYFVPLLCPSLFFFQSKVDTLF